MDNYKNMGIGETRMPCEICDKTVTTELSSDFTLPDYQPEIKRLLRVKTTVSPAEKYIGMGSAEFSGTVDYAILYAGNDGALYCANQSGDYRFTCPIEAGADFDLGDGLTCDVETVAESAMGRVSGPRRMSVKCRLRSRVRLLGTRLLEERASGVAEASIERLRGSTVCAQSFVGTGEVLELGDEILCDGTAEDLRVIFGEGQVFVSEATAGSGCVNCRGEVALRLLTCREGSDDAPTLQNRRIPFAASVPVDGAEINCVCMAHGVCSELRITVEEGRILCEVGVRLHAKAHRNVALDYTKDLYSTAAAGENTYETLRVPYLLKCTGGNFSLNTTLSMEEAGIRQGQSVVDVTLIPIALTLECANGKYTVGGKCRCQAILCGDGEYGAQEFEVPFRYECEGSEEIPVDYDLDLQPISCRARMDGERIAIDAELSVSIGTRACHEISVFREASFTEATPRRGAAYTVCYPSREDTLWSVAKRYRRSVSELGQMNPLQGAPAADARESLDGVGYLLV